MRFVLLFILLVTFAVSVSGKFIMVNLKDQSHITHVLKIERIRVSFLKKGINSIDISKFKGRQSITEFKSYKTQVIYSV